MKRTAIIQYGIAVPDKRLEKLHQKLMFTEFPDGLEDAQWKYRVPLYVCILSSRYVEWKVVNTLKCRDHKITQLLDWRI